MLRANITRIDDSVIAEGVEISGQDAKRGRGDLYAWRGSFGVRSLALRPTAGETINIVFEQGPVVACVTDVIGNTVHFRAIGRMPRPNVTG